MIGVAMAWPGLKRQSLNARLSILVLVIFVLGVVVQALYLSHELRRDIENQLSEQQFEAVTIVAGTINHDLAERITELELVARGIDESLLAKPAALQRFLKEAGVNNYLFNAGIFVLGKEGIAVADYPLRLGRIGTNYSDRDYFAEAIKLDRPIIGKPVHARSLQGAPTLPISVPVHDIRGRVIGVLVGFNDLSQPNFLDKITYGKSGKTGSYLIVSRQWRLIITSSDKRMIMTPQPASGAIPLIDRFIDGYEGSGVLKNKFGEERLASTKGVPVANWYVTNSTPTAEAFAGIRHMQLEILVSSIFLVTLAGGIAFYLVRLEVLPIVDTLKKLSATDVTSIPLQQLQIRGDRDVNDLIASFNHLLERLAERERALRESEAKSRAITQSANEAVVTGDSAGNIVGWNPGAQFIFGYLESEVVGQPIIKLIPEQYRDAHLAGMGLAVAGPENRVVRRSMELLGLRRDGSEFPIEISLSEWESDGVRFFTAIVRDISERKSLEEHVNRMAFYDDLTQMANRRLLKDRLKQAIASSQRNGRHGAAIFLDLDNFKSLNDARGHEVGDLLLIEVANRLTSCVRAVDTVARFGGDEFVVLISELSTDKPESVAQATIIAKKILAAISSPFLLQVLTVEGDRAPVSHHCSASLGVAFFGAKGTTPDEILRRADAAMYVAKKAGRNTIQIEAIAEA